MFKRSIAIVLALLIVLSMTACKSGKKTATVQQGETLLELTEFNIDDYDTSDIAQKTQAVKDYISSIFGKYTISGQVFSGDEMTEAVFIYSETGKLPAISGYDLGPVAWDETKTENIQKAIEWHNNSNGLVEFMWSVVMPINVNDYTKGTGRWQSDFNKAGRNINFVNTIIPGTREYEIFTQQLETVAANLKKLERLGVPVLFRPFHEAGIKGCWWWSYTPTLYKGLWNMTYDVLMNKYELKNIIWLWNGQSDAYFVDDDKFDIAVWDNYANAASGALGKGMWDKLKAWYPDRVLALGENGALPPIDQMVENDVRWAFWITWYGEYTLVAENGTYTSAEKWTPLQVLKDNYNSKYVITLDELPLWDKDNKREMPVPVQNYINTGYMPGGVAKWNNGEITLEFETGQHQGCLYRNVTSASGGGFIKMRGRAEKTEAFIPFNVPEGEAGRYLAQISYKAEGSDKIEDFIVNGLSTGKITYPLHNKFEIMEIEIELKEGVNYVGYTYQSGGYCYLDLDYVKLTKIKE